MSVARAIWFERRGVAAVRTQPLRAPERGEIVLRTLVTGISTGTEAIVLGGRVPRDAHAAMALPTMQGHFAFPISYGYACVGVIERGAEGDTSEQPARRWFALHPHHDRFTIARRDLRALPSDVPLARLVLAANLETAVNVCWDADIAIGDRVVVTGLGVLGLLALRLAIRSGASHVVGVDPDPERRAVAMAFGANETADEVASAPVSTADACIEASGGPAALEALVARAGAEARIVVASWYADRSCALQLGGTFHPNRVTIRSSQVAAIAARRRDRWTFARRWSLVGELLRDGALDRLLSPTVPFSDAPRVYAELASGVRWNPPQRVLDATQ